MVHKGGGIDARIVIVVFIVHMFCFVGRGWGGVSFIFATQDHKLRNKVKSK